MRGRITALTAAVLAVLAALGVSLPASAVPPSSSSPAPSGPRAPRTAAARPILAHRTPHARHTSDTRPANAPNQVRVEVDNLNPNVVTSDASTVTITGKLTNDSDRTIDDVQLRLQRGDAITSEDKLTSALTPAVGKETVRPPKFSTVADTLAPGHSVDFHLDVPLGVGQPDSLALSKPGVYPLLVNVNGTPADGGQARVGTASTLLPVVSAPGGSPAAPSIAPPSTTLLWPIAERPHVVGLSPDGKAVLGDDSLAASLDTGGRLFRLVDAVDQGLPLSSPSAPSLCLAIDPDLLDTVDAMARGYLVSAGEGTADGTGAGVAHQWLDRLRKMAQGRCVLALPYADADLVALTRAGLSDLADAAIGKDPRVDTVQTFQRVLGMSPLPDVVWPVAGLIDGRTAAELAKNGTKTLLLDPHSIQNAPAGPVRLAIGAGTGPQAVPIDPLVSSAWHWDATQAQASHAPAVQAVLGALVFRAEAPTPGQPVLIAPPTRWNASVDELAALLRTTQRLVDAQLLQPRSLRDLISAPTPERPVPVTYPVTASASEIPPSITADLLVNRNAQRDLVGSMSADVAVAKERRVEPAQLMAPELFGLLRGSSGAWRGDEAGAQDAVDAVTQQLESVQQQVQITAPPGTVTLTSSSDSTLPLSLSNQLPVLVDVQITLSDTAGLHTDPIEVQQVPAGPMGSRPLRIRAQVNRTGKFSVDVRISTPGGTPLGSIPGEPSRLQLRSTAFGTITGFVTGTAAVVLVVLMSMRIRRRIRRARAVPAVPAPAAGHPEEVGAGQRRGPAPG